MALFTDGPMSGMEDLTAQDTQLPNVANVERIDVTQKLLVAQEELAVELRALLNGTSRAEQAFWLRAQPKIANVVVTPELKLWHTFRTLELVYGDAFASQLNDRYAAKRDQFHQRASWAYDKLLLLGLGITWSPIARAGAPQVTASEGNVPDGTYYAAMTWTNSQGEEGTPSEATSITTAESTLLVQPITSPTGAAGWNVYVGTDPGALSRQNASPIAASQTWLQPDAVTTGGTAAGWGQSPNYFMAIPRMILRG
jgi:hypothetical protein